MWIERFSLKSSIIKSIILDIYQTIQTSYSLIPKQLHLSKGCCYCSLILGRHKRIDTNIPFEGLHGAKRPFLGGRVWFERHLSAMFNNWRDRIEASSFIRATKTCILISFVHYFHSFEPNSLQNNKDQTRISHAMKSLAVGFSSHLWQT